ncbi:hypothetical protein V1279_004353 [Bradyrhizobium sp. AZCC 1610]
MRGHEFAVQLLAERITADEAVGSHLDIDDRRPGMFGELLQRAIDVKRGLVGARLLERGQHDRSAGVLQGFGKVSVRRRIGRRGEVDVERDVLDVRLLKLPDQFGVEQARPWPDADPVDRRCVDRDHHDVAADLSRLPGEPQVGQGVAKRAVPAARQDDCQRNHHEDMRPISFHLVTILVFRV